MTTVIRAFLAVMVVAGAPFWAFGDEGDPAERLIEILMELQGDPEALAEIRATLLERLDLAREAASEEVDRRDALEGALAAKGERIAELKAALSELEVTLRSEQAEAARLQAELAALGGGEELPVLERSLELIEVIAPGEVAAEGDSGERIETAAVEFTAEQRVFFEKQVLAVLAQNCFECHGAETQRSGMRLDSRDGMLTGGERGAAIVPGKPEESRLIGAIRREGDLKMPPNHELPADAVASLREWVRLGAPWPGDIVAPSAPVKAPAAVEQAPAAPRAPVAVPAEVSATQAAAGTVDFNRDIRPILSDRCFACHGPDAATRKAGLRFDDGEGGYIELRSGNRAIVPGDRESSALWHRITASESGDRMPPASFEKGLSAEEIETLGRWIDEGARWDKHWSFITPTRPALPEVSDASWARNEIDYFILARLDEEGLHPSEEADKRRLIRRVTFDLTGLPPTAAEVEAFVNDTSPEAYENLVDRLLASARYGEHMARHWLDLARYADTNGYHIDNERYMWRWRDWVIEKFNENKPFDEFTVEQIAGDLLPDRRRDQLIATGFNRNHMINFEGGAIPEEYRTQYVVDRLDATSTVWMGLTVSCAQCHDHKYDPISQKEYFEMFAFFNTVPEDGLDGRTGNAKPFVEAPLPEQEEALAELRAAILRVETEMNKPDPDIDAAQAAWEREISETLAGRWTALRPESVTSAGGATLTVLDDQSVLASGETPDHDTYEIVARVDMDDLTAIRLEALTDSSMHFSGVGRADNANFVLTEIEAELAPVSNPDNWRPLRFAAANADFEQPDFPVSRAIDGNGRSGWGPGGDKRRENRTAVFALERPAGDPEGALIRIRLKHESQFPRHTLGRFRLSVANEPSLLPAQMGPWHVSGPYKAYDGQAAYDTAFEPEEGIDLTATYEDGRFKWVKALPGYADGEIHDLFGEIAATYLYRTIHAPTSREVTLSLGSNDAIKVWLNGRVVHDNNVERTIEKDQDRIAVRLDEGQNTLLMKVVNYGNNYSFYFNRANEELGEVPLDIAALFGVPFFERTDEEVLALRSFYRRSHSPAWAALERELAQLRDEEQAVERAIPTVMVMAEMEEPRETFILMRGQYDLPTEKVEAATPAVLPPVPEGYPNNRLGFARWLVSPEHPLTSRVVVNRYWQRYFGTGLVRTSEDFGAQGEWPSHPELLDWLAVEFMESGWDVKAMQRLIVTSAAYRQSSRVTPELRERDRNNRLLARGPRLRLDAEMVRDNALALAGLLVEKVGGPSVRPYQPKGIWEEVAYGAEYTAQRFEPDTGDSLYRRSMYTFWKRQAPPPGMMLFDAPNRETCTARRASTNTPLQALALMNDVQYVEAARAFAERILREGGETAQSRIEFAYLTATARLPREDEQAILLKVCREEMARYREHVDAASELIATGDSAPDPALDASELAAWTIVASMILNLDETITKS